MCCTLRGDNAQNTSARSLWLVSKRLPNLQWHSEVVLRRCWLCKRIHTFVQGNCTKPLQSARRSPPLETFKPGQCLLDAELAHFTFLTRPSPANVWFSNLYLRAFSRTQDVETLISFVPGSITTLWLTNATTQGGAIGLLAQSTTFVAGAPTTYAISCVTLWHLARSVACMPVNHAHAIR